MMERPSQSFIALLRKPVAYTHSSRHLLWCLLLAEIALHLSLVWSSQQLDLWSASCLFWLAALAALWQRRSALRQQLQSSRVAIALGTFLLAWLLFKSFVVYDADVYLRLYPLFASLSVCLISSGFSGLRQYAVPLQLVVFLAVPWELLYWLDLTQLTANTAEFLLGVLGYSVTHRGASIALPNAAIEIYDGCSGVKLIAQLLSFTWIYVCLRAPRLGDRVLAIVGACTIGFFINAFRVAAIAILNNAANFDALAFWHYGRGSLLIPAVAAGLYGIFLWQLNQRSPRTQASTL
ncbi:MAG: cyanoexosortase A [Cyanobacteria bacterium P01_A01_bin.3]